MNERQICISINQRFSQESIYCVSEAPVSQLRFVCLDCEQKNITDMVPALNSAQDLTRSAGFPVRETDILTIPINFKFSI